MLGTSRTGIRFHCPECGLCLRAPQADAGSAIECEQCGESVRVPRFPHPLESDGDAGPLVAPFAAQQAASGVRLLMGSLAVFAAIILGTVILLGIWIANHGPTTVLQQEPGWLGGWMRTVGLLQFFAFTLTAILRWIGYGRCRSAAFAVRAGMWVSAARLGVILSVIGLGLSTITGGVVLSEPDFEAVFMAIGQLGDWIRIAGMGLEFGILFVWSRLLTEFRGQAVAARVGSYAVLVVAAIGGFTASLCAAGAVIVMALREHAPTPNPPRSPFPHFDWSAMPSDGWYALAGVVLIGCGFAGVLSVQYWRVLRTMRTALLTGESGGTV